MKLPKAKTVFLGSAPMDFSVYFKKLDWKPMDLQAIQQGRETLDAVSAADGR